MDIAEIYSDKDHYQLFEKPRTSVDSGLYKKYKDNPRELDEVTEYFKFEEYRKRGFTNKFLNINPYERWFAQFVENLEKKYEHLPPSESYVRIMAEMQSKHALAMQQLTR